MQLVLSIDEKRPSNLRITGLDAKIKTAKSLGTILLSLLHDIRANASTIRPRIY